MRAHTTYTDLRRIMRLYADGNSADIISQHMAINLAEVQKCIDARTAGSKKTKKSKTTE